MPEPTLFQLRLRARDLIPKVRARLIRLITQHRPNTTPEQLAGLPLPELMTLAETCMPNKPNLDDINTLLDRPEFMRNVEFIAPHKVNSLFDLVRPCGPLAWRLLRDEIRRDQLRDIQRWMREL